MLLKEIENRRSVRKFLNKDLSQEQIDLLLLAGSKAPSAFNKQPWEFIVVTNKELLNKITEFHKYTQMLKQAPVAIIVLGNKEVTTVDEFIFADCSAVSQNILIQATHMDLGSCWCAVGPNEERINGVKQLFNIPDNLVPVSIIALGYEDGSRPSVEKSLENKVHYNKYK